MASKMVIVKSRGYVDTSRGRHIFTPISRPWRETIDVILSMIVNDRADVWEVLPDKTEVKLTTTNYDKDNRIKPVPKEETPKKEPVFTKPVEPVISSPATFKEEPSDSIPERDENGHIIFPEETVVEDSAPQHDAARFNWEDQADETDPQSTNESTETEPVVPLDTDDTTEIADVPEPMKDSEEEEESDDESADANGDKKSKKRNRHRR